MISRDHWNHRADPQAQPADQSAAVAEGFVLVPIEPDDAMQGAGASAVRIATTVINKMFTANRVYRDMIAAAPKP